MFVWLIEGKLGKAAWDDIGTLPNPCLAVIVAAEYKLCMVPLVDEDTYLNYVPLANAVTLTLFNMATVTDRPVVTVCQQGRSRSVVVACLAAALYQGRTFWDVLEELRSKDPEVFARSPLVPIASQLFPKQFEESLNDE